MSQHEEEEHKPKFRVVDRRRFDAEGETKDGVEDRANFAAPPPAEPAPTAPSPKTDPRAAAPRQEPVAAGPGRDIPEPPPGTIDFLSFVASLATNALGALGALPPGYGPPMPADPALAKEYIEILGMLQYKTRGNLSAKEADGMQRLLTDLRMHYVEATQGPGPGAGLPGIPGAPKRR